MKQWILFLFVTILFTSCVEDVKLDKDEEALPIPCFQSATVVGCETNPVPMPSDLMLMGVPQGTELNLSAKNPFTITFSTAFSTESLTTDRVLIYKNGQKLSTESYMISTHPQDSKTALIIPTSGSWDRGSTYVITITKGVLDINQKRYTQPLPLYFATYDTALSESGKSTYPTLFDDSKSVSLEQLRLAYQSLFTLVKSDVEKSDILMIWSVTFKSEEIIPCFQSLSIEGCENATEVPIPSDFVVDFSGDTPHLNLPITDDMSETERQLFGGINTLDGWGVTKPISIQLSSAINPETLDADLSDGDFSAVVLKLTLNDTEVVSTYSIFDPNSKRVVFVPQIGVWEPKSLYLVVLTNRVGGANGETLRSSTAFSIMKSETSLLDADKNSLYSGLTNDKAALLEKGRVLMNQLFAGIAQAPLSLTRADVVMMYTVTTQSTIDDLVGIRELLYNGTINAPTDERVALSVSQENIPSLVAQVGIDLEEYASYLGYDSGEDLYIDVSYLVWGNFKSPYYLSSTTGAFDPSITPLNPSMKTIEFYMVIPKESDGCVMPENGFPIVIFQHGLGAEKGQMMGLVNFFASNCYATIGIDAVKHGSRADEGKESGDGFFSTNLFASRDNMRQTIIDQIQLKRAIDSISAETPTGFPDGVKIDSTQTYYFGISLGGILGTLFMTVENSVKVGVLNVPGGGLTDILIKSQTEEINASIFDALAAQGIEKDTPAFDQFMFFAQLILDRSDPKAYAPFTVNSFAKKILIQKAVGDQVIDNSTTDDLARVMGLDKIIYTSYEGTDVHHGFIFFNSENPNAARAEIIQFYNNNSGVNND